MSTEISDIIGRDDVNDLEAILAVTNTDVDAVSTRSRTTPTPSSRGTTTLARPALRKLYEKAKTGQWNGETDLPWDTEVDQEAVVIANAAAAQGGVGIEPRPLHGTPVEKWGDKEWLEFGIESQNWTLQPVPPRRAGRAAVHGEDRRDGAVDRRQVLRLDAGGGRGPPRRGVREVPRHEARRRTTRSTRTCACCSTTSSTTAAGT